MSESEQSRTVDDILSHRESLREKGIFLTLEQLCEGVAADVSEEVARRLADVIAAEEAIEMSWGGELTEAERQPFTPLGSAGRYVEPEIRGEGGMGVLCVARDVELGRFVAYKIMRPGQDRNPVARELFFNEAQITSRLAHPGIVPVFGRVTDDSGFPAYASEYVSGKTLEAEILRLHAMDVDNNDERKRTRAELLRVFIATCQIVAYAHSKNVVHGDIKPSNIMIDDFGATRLVDWGVARVVDPIAEKAKTAGPPTPRRGTPSFISSPDTPSSVAGDIFALGQTLLWILKDGVTQEQGANAARPVPSGALWSIARKAMESKHDKRYQSAAELARETQDVLDDKPITAYRDPWPTRLRRWANRNRPIVASVLAILLLAAIFGPVIAQRERRLRQRAEAGRRQAEELTEEMLKEAEIVGKLQATLPDSKAILVRAVRLIDQLARDGEAEGADPRPVAANYYRAGSIHLTLNQLAEAAECFQHTNRLAERQSAISPGDAETRNLWAGSLRDWGVTLHLQGKKNDAGEAWMQAVKVLEPVVDQSPAYRWTLAKVRIAIGNQAMFAKDQERARASFREALALASKSVADAPNDARFLKTLADAHSNIGFSLQMEAAPDSRTLLDPKKLAEATVSHREALEIRRRLTRIEPGKPEHLADVGVSLNHLGNASLSAGETGFADAEKYYREARSILESLAVAYPGAPNIRREVAMVYSNFNVLFTRQNRSEEATTLAKAGVELFTRIVMDYPDVPDLHANLGVALEQFANNLRERGEVAEAGEQTFAAAAEYARAVGLTGDLNPKSPLVKKSIALLAGLQTDGYFQNSSHAAALHAEPAFKRLSSLPGFPSF